MRVVLVGSASDRARLRAQMNGSLTIVGEFPTMADARAAGVEAEGILVAGRTRRSAAPTDDVTSTDDVGADLRVGPEALTRREVEVLELLAEGLPNKAIAARLGISDQTVKFHVAAISGKLGAANRTDAVRRAVRRGLITL
jgi:DNA-binding NarL/FixJ family response regulator